VWFRVVLGRKVRRELEELASHELAQARPLSLVVSWPGAGSESSGPSHAASKLLLTHRANRLDCGPPVMLPAMITACQAQAQCARGSAQEQRCSRRPEARLYRDVARRNAVGIVRASRRAAWESAPGSASGLVWRRDGEGIATRWRTSKPSRRGAYAIGPNPGLTGNVVPILRWSPIGRWRRSK